MLQKQIQHVLQVQKKKILQRQKNIKCPLAQSFRHDCAEDFLTNVLSNLPSTTAGGAMS